MNWLKALLMSMGLVLGLIFVLALLGFLFVVSWYLVGFGIIILAIYGCYKFFGKGGKKELKGLKDSQLELENLRTLEFESARIIEALEDLKVKNRDWR